MEIFLGFVFICLVLGAIGITYGKGKEESVVPIQQGSIRTHPDNRRKLNISQPVSEMIKIIESGEGFTLTSFCEYGYYGSVYYLSFGEFSPQFVVSDERGYSYVGLDWMTSDEKKALVCAVYEHLAKEKVSAEQKERNRWCEILNVTQTTEEKTE